MKSDTFRLEPTSNELLHLDALRFIASAGIIYHHSHEFFHAPAERAAVGEFTDGLSLFVDLFFALSGFVIAYFYAGRVDTFGGFARFMQRRIGRLIPLHWLTLAVSMAIYLGAAAVGANLAHAPEFRADCVATTALLLPIPADCGTTRFNGVSWSIAAEMGMYILFPIFAWIGIKRRAAPLLLGVAALVANLVFLWRSDALGLDDWTELPDAIRALPSFLIGAGLWFERDALKLIPHPRVLLYASTALMIGAMMLGAPVAFILVPVYLVIVSGTASDLHGPAGAIGRSLAPLGQLTYSMYMWHSAIILVLLNAVGDKILHLSPTPMIGLAVATYAVIGLVSLLSLKLFEEPARRWIDRLPITRGLVRRPGV